MSHKPTTSNTETLVYCSFVKCFFSLCLFVWIITKRCCFCCWTHLKGLNIYFLVYLFIILHRIHSNFLCFAIFIFKYFCFKEYINMPCRLFDFRFYKIYFIFYALRFVTVIFIESKLFGKFIPFKIWKKIIVFTHRVEYCFTHIDFPFCLFAYLLCW